MNTLSKYKKYIVYNIMRNSLQEVSDATGHTGFCSAVPNLMLYTEIDRNNLCIEPTSKIVEVLLPELYAYKPKINEDGAYWYDRTNISLRIGILNDIIDFVWYELNVFQKIYITLFKKGIYPPLSKG